MRQQARRGRARACTARVAVAARTWWRGRAQARGQGTLGSALLPAPRRGGGVAPKKQRQRRQHVGGARGVKRVCGSRQARGNGEGSARAKSCSDDARA
jgi:hypothetical protein